MFLSTHHYAAEAYSCALFSAALWVLADLLKGKKKTMTKHIFIKKLQAMPCDGDTEITIRAYDENGVGAVISDDIRLKVEPATEDGPEVLMIDCLDGLAEDRSVPLLGQTARAGD